MSFGLLDPTSCVVVAVDLQEKLIQVMANSEMLVQRTALLLDVARTLDIPIVATEQYPEGLGRSVQPIMDRLESAPIISKTAFGAFDDPTFVETLSQTGRRSVVLAGIECHVCVLQTALQSLDRRFQVTVVADAVSSRHKSDLDLGLRRMERSGIVLTSVESVAFEWLKTADHPRFKTISRLIR